jgi:hypothetical protein
MKTKTPKETIGYRGFEICLWTRNTRFGTLYQAFNNIGEPYTYHETYRTRDDAINAEKNNIDQYLNEQ